MCLTHYKESFEGYTSLVYQNARLRTPTKHKDGCVFIFCVIAKYLPYKHFINVYTVKNERLKIAI